MTTKEVGEILSMFQCADQYYYMNKSPEELTKVVTLWHSFFSNYDFTVVKIIAMQWIKNNKRGPVISEFNTYLSERYKSVEYKLRLEMKNGRHNENTTT